MAFISGGGGGGETGLGYSPLGVNSHAEEEMSAPYSLCRAKQESASGAVREESLQLARSSQITYCPEGGSGSYLPSSSLYVAFIRR